MHIRTFRAANLNAALAMIREQMGPDASVLHTRQVSTGMLRLLGHSKIEVTAGLRHVSADAEGAHAAATSAPLTSALLTSAPLTSATAQSATAPSGQTPRARPRRTASVLDSTCAAELSLAEELSDAGLPRALAERWLDRCREAPSGSLTEANLLGRREAPADPQNRLRGRLSAWLAEAIPTAPPIRVIEGQRRIAALVGATGVGKTTTIAKLAARFRMDRGARVGLLTVDAFRAAAVEQLDAFARAMRAPIEVVRRAEDVPEALQRLADVDLILVDTVGQSPRGGQRIDALARLLAAIAPDETFLVIDANNSILAARDSLRAFGALAPNAVILSKTDEVRQPAPVLAPIIETGLGIGYVTHGQMVPDDIAAVDVDALANWTSGLAVDIHCSVISTPRSRRASGDRRYSDG